MPVILPKGDLDYLYIRPVISGMLGRPSFVIPYEQLSY